MDLIDAMTNRKIRSVREKSSLNRRMCIRFESLKICVAGNQCDDSDFDFHNAEHKELPVIKISSTIETNKGLRFLWEPLITVTILLISSILFSRIKCTCALYFSCAYCDADTSFVLRVF